MLTSNASAGFGGGTGNDYTIRDLNGLEQSAAELAKYNQNISLDAADLKTALTTLQTNWQNEAGADITSMISALREVINSITGEIVPAIATYINIMNSIVLETRSNQSKTLQ